MTQKASSGKNFRLNEQQSRKLLQTVKFCERRGLRKSDLQKLFLSRIENAIQEFSAWQSITKTFSAKQVKEELDVLRRCASTMSVLLGKRVGENDLSEYGRLNHESLNRIGDRLLIWSILSQNYNGTESNPFLDVKEVDRIFQLLEMLFETANSTLDSERFKKWKTGARKKAYIDFFIEDLAVAYKVATNKMPGIGRDTIFYRLAHTCFSYTDNPIDDPLPYIKRVFPSKDKKQKRG